MPTGGPEFHVPYLHLDVLNHSSLSLLRPASPAHVHGMPTTAVVNTSVEQAPSSSSSSVSSSLSASSTTRHGQTTISPDITTHNDKVLAPSSFLRRYLRMLHRRENESNNNNSNNNNSSNNSQASLSKPSSICASPSVESRKEHLIAEREVQSSPQRHTDDSSVKSQNSGGPAIASLERFIGIERRSRSLSEQLRQQHDSHHHRHELKDDNLSRTSSPQKDMSINIPSPLAQSKFPSHLSVQHQQQRRQSSHDSLKKTATRWTDEKLAVITDSSIINNDSSNTNTNNSHTTVSTSNELPSPCLSLASSNMSITSSPVGMDTISFDSNRSSATSIGPRKELNRMMTTTAPVSILQTPPMSGGSNGSASCCRRRQQQQQQHHHESHALRPKARTITGHRRQVSAHTSHPQPIRTTSMRSISGASMPRVTASSYDQLPCSPAVSFLSMFAQSTCGPTAEEEEILREDEAGDEVGGYVLGCELSRGHFSTVREAYHIEETKVKVGPVVVKIVRRGDVNLYSLRRNSEDQQQQQQQSYNTTTSTSSYITDRTCIDSSTTETAETAEEAMRQELQIWRRLRHPNILPLLDFFESPMALYAVSPRCPNGSLYHALRRFRKRDINGHDNHGLMAGGNDGGFNLMSSYSSTNEIRGLAIEVTRQIVAQLVSAIRYLHYDAAVAHGDLKLENVLINASGHVQIIDFGLSRELFDDNNNHNNSSITTTTSTGHDYSAGGSLPYCAPELIRNHQPVSPASDCWALGVMIYALLMDELPFQDAYEPRLIFKIIHAQYELPDEEEEENSDSMSGGFCSASDWGALMGATSNSSYNDDSTSSNTKLPSTAIAVIRNLLCVDIKQRWDTRHLVACDWLKNTDPSEPIGLDFAST